MLSCIENCRLFRWNKEWCLDIEFKNINARFIHVAANGSRDCHSKWSESEREKEIFYDIAYMQNLFLKRYKWIYFQNRHRLTDLGKELLVARGRELGEGMVREFGRDMYTLLHLKWITNKDLPYKTGNAAQNYGTT